ncbi:polyketide synthase [Actinoplanes ianthinogenes]|uniref:Polyketide synthase n=1 Tax=Actinoplanes ianthinogenes TaxID=122358 RepID=A0ABM7LPF6_9ACTN|nr:type I polyketide synthase [Actinoplanes ianthinogenes]BCJ41158.1 polyketide synthase [Actinoplanes ianthinogenes]GGR22507.1 polyketide synthase [Actinoplanes ianthinogenes]
MTRIAVVGMACRYPDAATTRELWENALAGRRAFRRLPDQRMRLDDYWSADPATPDTFYARNAAVIEGYQFDRVAYKVAGSTYRSTDLTHWLALDIAANALADAGFPQGAGLPRERTGVVVGNSLTGEFSRASQIRLRWPYVKRTVAAALKAEGWDDEQLAGFLADLEVTFKNPFAPVDEDTLAGALSNTIAGRICNYFDLKGGGYTVDGACSSSLLSVATACKALLDGDIDVAIAGGVDLSIDPFEIIGFAKTGALATGEMRVYDRLASGFWPGEGCGMVVLMREDEALAAGHRVYASVAGWGISSDGKGGMTRPEVSGYQLALRRAYERSGFGPETVSLFEGHGTGTKVGDATELGALSATRRAADPAAPPAVITSIKGMIGHAKAAAGVAGMIKAVLALHHEVLPPSIGSVEPHEILTGPDPALRLLRKAEQWPQDAPLRAGVTAMGFGGINTHVVLENSQPRRRAKLDSRTRLLAGSVQDAELLLLDGASAEDLLGRIDQVLTLVPSLAYGQLGDLAATLHDELRDRPLRAGVVAQSPADAEEQLRKLRDAVAAGETRLLAGDSRILLNRVTGPARIGYLFPGQGSGTGVSGGALGRRFTEADAVYTAANLPTGGDVVATEVAQPRIVTGSVAALRVLDELGVSACVAVGHSLGEIAALHWAGALDETTLLRVAALRGRTMAEHSSSGTMAGIGASAEVVAGLLTGLPVVIAAYNSDAQTVVAGSVDDVTAVCRRAWDQGLAATVLNVSHAFHSPLVAPAADTFVAALAGERLGPVRRTVLSTVTGAALAPDTDVAALLRRQITDPVLFRQAVTQAAAQVDLLVEVGPGRVLSSLAGQLTDVPALAVDTDSESLTGLLRAAGAAYVLGAATLDSSLFHGRLVRDLPLDAEFDFFSSPCEQAPVVAVEERRATPVEDKAAPVVVDGAESTLDLLRRLAAERAELPIELVRDDSLLLDDLHLSSITVGQVVNAAAAALKLPPSQVPTNFATARVAELAAALDQIRSTTTAGDEVAAPVVAGAAAWARPFRLDLAPVPLGARTAPEPSGAWSLHAPAGHPYAEQLRRGLQTAETGAGVLVCLPEACSEDDLELALTGAREALAAAPQTRFVLVQHGRGAAGLAKTLRLEAPHLRVTVVHLPAGSLAFDRVVAEVAATASFTEAHYDEEGTRRVPTLRPMPVRPARTEAPLTGTDVLLVTGGGKGITAECALAIAGDTGAALALIGRSDPADDRELAANLDRIAAAGVRCHYERADVTDTGQVRRAVDRFTAELGPVTAILHGAGRNEPAALTNLDRDAFRRTFAPKVDGLRTVLDVVDPGRLRLLVSLGSIIGRAGLRGEAHYATANEWLADLTTEVGRTHPHCRSVCLEWSVWSGVGMGERLAVVESLTRDGVTPITPDQGVGILRRVLADPQAPDVVVISGRTEGIDTVRRPLPPLPLSRFVDRPLVRYHGVELVCEVELNVGTDLYLADHDLDGNLLLPAVFGMEAMAQVAAATTGVETLPVIEQAEFLRPIIVPPNGRATIRVAAVVTDDDTVEVAIRSVDTGYAADHFTARLRLGATEVPQGEPEQVPAEVPPVELVPADDLYSGLLFQGARFQRLRRYHSAAARYVDAEVAAEPDVQWFAAFVPDHLLLGDPGVRDTLMHGNQVCVPDATLLPVGVDRIYPGGEKLTAAQGLRYCATERSRDGDLYVYDVALRSDAGEVLERWEGLRLRAVRKQDPAGPWVPALLGPYLERAVDDLLGKRVAVTVVPDGGLSRREATRLAATRTFRRPVEPRYRADGRPEVDEGVVSAAHAAALTLFTASSGVLGCDLEVVAARDAGTWSGLLGQHAELARQVAAATGESHDVAATRVWTALESLRKAGRSLDGPLTVLPAVRDRWVLLRAGDLRVATFATAVRDLAEPIVVAVLAETGE